MTVAERTRQLTALIPERWPYAPLNARILVVPASTYQGDWGGRWSWDTNTAYINADLDFDVQQGVAAHELAHARWSTPLPDLPGEEGAAALALELFDELRVEHFAIAAAPFTVRADIRCWLRHDVAATIPIPNYRAAALGYGYLIGHHHTGAITADEAKPLRRQFHNSMGAAWCGMFDRMLHTVLHVRPGATGTLIALARQWDRQAVQTAV